MTPAVILISLFVSTLWTSEARADEADEAERVEALERRVAEAERRAAEAEQRAILAENAALRAENALLRRPMAPPVPPPAGLAPPAPPEPSAPPPEAPPQLPLSPGPLPSAPPGLPAQLPPPGPGVSPPGPGVSPPGPGVSPPVPGAAPEAPIAPPAPGAPPRLSAGAELYTNLNFSRVDLMQAGVEGDPAVFFSLDRGLVWLEGRPASFLEAAVMADVRQEHGLQPADAPTLPIAASGWELRLMDARVSATGRAGRFTMGLQRKEFGLRASYAADFFMGGAPEQFLEPELRWGVVPERTLGLGWERDFGDRLDATVQITNTASYLEAEGQNGKDLVARVRARPVPAVELGVSGVYGALQDTPHAAWAASVQVAPGATRGVVELVGAQQRGASLLGGMGTLAHDFGLPGETLEHLTVLGRVMVVDPDRNAALNNELSAAAAGQLVWNKALSTGVLWEMVIPENADLAIEHDVFLSTVVRF